MSPSLHRPVVLVYHAVNRVEDRDDPLRLVTPPAYLEAHLKFLLRVGYRFTTAGAVAARGELPPCGRTAVVTFDDGWSDALTVVVPTLKRLGIPATFYVNPGLWGAQHRDVTGPAAQLLDEEGARELLSAGMEIASHTMTHPDLTRLDDDRLAWELETSKAAVETLTGERCRTLAYPYGAYDERTESAAVAAGYDLAFAWQPGAWRAHAAPRLPAPSRHGAARLALKLLGVRRRRRRPGSASLP